MINRNIWATLKSELENEEVLVITGARQVGKTTTIQWLLSQIPSPNKYYFDFENVINRDLFSIKDYDRLIDEFRRLGLDTSKKVYIALDEIQLLPEIPSIIKYITDHYNIKFIASGSSSYYLKNLFSESLAGRKILHELYPLSFSEFLQSKQQEYQLPDFRYDMPFSKHAYQKLYPFYKEYIQFGGLPKVVYAKTPEEKKRYLETIFSDYINIDVRSLSDFKSLRDFRTLVALLAARIGNKVNMNQLANITGLSRQTVDSYISFMEQTYLIRLVQAYSKSSDVKARIAPKLYFVDTGLANINYDLSVGVQFENTACHQLFLHAEKTAFERKLQYFTDGRSEIDFILNDQIAFEVKETPLQTDTKQLQNNAAKIGLNTCRLIGHNKPASFDDFLWAGMIA